MGCKWLLVFETAAFAVAADVAVVAAVAAGMPYSKAAFPAERRRKSLLLRLMRSGFTDKLRFLPNMLILRGKFRLELGKK